MNPEITNFNPKAIRHQGAMVPTAKGLSTPARPLKTARLRSKALLLAAVFSFSLGAAFSQEQAPPYKANRNLPVFKLETAEGTVFYSTQLKKNVPSILMFFSPGCDHCIHQFNDMAKRISDLKKYQIVMATYQPMDELAEFNKKYKLSKYPNITIGRDSDYFFPPFYQIGNFPHFAFYDKSGKLIDVFEGNISVDSILKRFK